MKTFILGLFLSCALIGGVIGWWLKSAELRTSTTVISKVDPACVSIRREERRIIDLYMLLLGREEIRLEEDRRKIALEFQQKLAAVVQDGEKRDCP